MPEKGKHLSRNTQRNTEQFVCVCVCVRAGVRACTCVHARGVVCVCTLTH